MTYKLTVTYAAGHSQEHPGLTAEQIETGTGAFVRDLALLKGRGITKLVAEIEDCDRCGLPVAEHDETCSGHPDFEPSDDQLANRHGYEGGVSYGHWQGA